jgi:hypothetical protein
MTLGHIQVNIIAMKMQQGVLCVMPSYVTVKNIKILNVAQQCLYTEFMSLATIKYT